jgi:hypothetical protein
MDFCYKAVIKAIKYESMFCVASHSSSEQFAEKLSSHKIVAYPDTAVPKIPKQFQMQVSTVAANEHISYEMLTIQLG